MRFDPLAFPGPLQRGARDTNPSGPVHRLQGWLRLNGHGCEVDGDFGPRTLSAYKRWQIDYVPENATRDLRPIREELDLERWVELTAPLARAMCTVDDVVWHPGREADDAWPRSVGLGEAVAKVARQWLAQEVGGGPLRELPGNSGPVVEACTDWLAKRDRLPCFCGKDHAHNISGKCMDVRSSALGCACHGYAPDWRLPWCAGWVSTVLRQASESLGVPMPIKGSLSCDELARQAQKDGHYLPGGYNLRLDMLKPGDVFLVRGAKPGDWVHCGVVLEVLPPVPLMTLEGRKYEGGGLRTAEGNTNADGSRNGTELRERIRAFEGLDFICWRDA